MKRIMVVAVVAVVCIALLAGKDDIARFRRMRSM